ncbi:response regulator transcription factor [Paenibacillus flagellatus]|uniref:DNA-binding response regulator n=1 Tax=Paenibacillus flagellatus TaxID=2211139 RepID=A0A2V5KCL1_9BACL|nr:response regulator transcription factor [Paenibacillus flagellatus]PYI57258.1 DNA-binding response regulator [Paenibacillus flagellatus]
MNEAAILLVDDEQAILQLLETVLRKEGFRSVDKAGTAEAALAACRSKAYDLIVLDVMLPDMSGVEACSMIRRLSEAPILFLSARATDLDKLTGFAVGGDDYVTKPFNPLEVVARIRSLLRRTLRVGAAAGATGLPVHDFGRFQVYEASAELWVEGVQVACPSLVFQLLLFLCRHPNRIFTKSELYERVWGESSICDDNTVMVHIRKIRERIEADPGQPEYLLNVRGLGYKLAGRRAVP